MTQISPGSPSGILRRGIIEIMIEMMVHGSGCPIEPSFSVPFSGFKVTTGDVSEKAIASPAGIPRIAEAVAQLGGKRGAARDAEGQRFRDRCAEAATIAGEP